MSEGLRRAGFDVTAVDIRPQRHHRGGDFVQADALEFPLEGFDFIHASPPCQAHTSLRALHPGREYPDLIPAIRARLEAQGAPWCIENVPGAPLGAGHYLIQLCGTMFGLQTPDGRAEIRRHRLFELSFCPGLTPACQHGYVGEALSVTGTGLDSNKTQWRKRVENGTTGRARRVICVAGGKAMAGGMMEPQGMRKRRGALSVVGRQPEISRPGWHRRAMSVTGSTPQTNTVHNVERETFSVDDARAAMQIDWMPMSALSQAIPPCYGEWIGRAVMRYLTAIATIA